MKALITTSVPTLRRANSPYLGRLFTPRMIANVDGTEALGMTYAGDNDCYSGFHKPRYLAMLSKLADREKCAWVTARDVVGDAKATLAYFDEWEPVLRACGVPAALVAQDGLTPDMVPWERVDALFIGGSTEFKEGPDARLLVTCARLYGKWVHMGRVNAPARIEYAYRIGCDSIDGSSFGRFPQKITQLIEWMEELHCGRSISPVPLTDAPTLKPAPGANASCATSTATAS